MADVLIVLITADSKKTSKAIIKLLLEKRLAACVQETAQVNSAYWWKGGIRKSREIPLVIKTIKQHLNTIIKEVKKIHPYEVPEIISVNISGGSADYIKWIKKETKSLKKNRG